MRRGGVPYGDEIAAALYSEDCSTGGLQQPPAPAAESPQNFPDRNGHRDRIKRRFMRGDPAAMGEQALLELLLSFAIARRDVQPLARSLLEKYHTLRGVLAADPAELCSFSCITDSHSVVLLKLVDRLIQMRSPTEDSALAAVAEGTPPSPAAAVPAQPVSDPTPPGTEEPEQAPDSGETVPGGAARSSRTRARFSRPKQGISSKTLLRQAVHLLPLMSTITEPGEALEFLRQNLPYSAQETRQRYAGYLWTQTFTAGYPDAALQRFAALYGEGPELRDICYYRFCKAEPLMYDIVREVLLPAIGAGEIERARMREYLRSRFPESGSIREYTAAVIEALAAAAVATVSEQGLQFGYRSIPLPSLAFILHSEFPEPGMYAIERLDDLPAVRAMLWRPDRLLDAIYELRNRGILSKVSEIDRFRQFTTRWTLQEMVEGLRESLPPGTTPTGIIRESQAAEEGGSQGPIHEG